MRLIRRLLLAALVLLLALVALPPLWFALLPATPAPALPAAGRHVELPGGVGVNVLEQGSGPPVVLVHGLPGSGYEWRLLADALAARGRRAIAYDRVGFGRSDARPENGAYGLESNADDLLALLAALALSDATVVGWSYGGGTAMLAAKKDPSRIGRVVLVGSTGPGVERRRPPALVRLLTSDAGLAWLRAVPPASRRMRAAVSDVAFSGQPMPDWWLPLLDANFGRPHTRHSYVGELRAAGSELPPDSADLELPVLVIHGDDDRLSPVAIGRELERRASDGTLVVVPGGSHMLPVTHPDLLADRIVAQGDR